MRDLDAPAVVWHFYTMQLFRTIAMVILVLIVPLSGAYAGTWALPAPAEAYEKAAPETPTWSDHVHLRTQVALTAACHAALPGAPCHPEYLLLAMAEPGSRGFAREHRRVDRRQIRVGLIPPSIYHPPRSR